MFQFILLLSFTCVWWCEGGGCNVEATDSSKPVFHIDSSTTEFVANSRENDISHILLPSQRPNRKGTLIFANESIAIKGFAHQKVTRDASENYLSNTPHSPNNNKFIGDGKDIGSTLVADNVADQQAVDDKVTDRHEGMGIYATSAVRKLERRRNNGDAFKKSEMEELVASIGEDDNNDDAAIASHLRQQSEELSIDTSTLNDLEGLSFQQQFHQSGLLDSNQISPEGNEKDNKLQRRRGKRFVRTESQGVHHQDPLSRRQPLFQNEALLQGVIAWADTNAAMLAELIDKRQAGEEINLPEGLARANLQFVANLPQAVATGQRVNQIGNNLVNDENQLSSNSDVTDDGQLTGNIFVPKSKSNSHANKSPGDSMLGSIPVEVNKPIPASGSVIIEKDDAASTINGESISGLGASNHLVSHQNSETIYYDSPQNIDRQANNVAGVKNINNHERNIHQQPLLGTGIVTKFLSRLLAVGSALLAYQ